LHSTKIFIYICITYFNVKTGIINCLKAKRKRMKTIIMKVTVAYLVRLAQQDSTWNEVISELNSRVVEEKETYFILK